MKFKRLISSLLVAVSIIGMGTQQTVNALTQGDFSTGGGGVSWICGAKSWPCFTITMLNEEFSTPIKPIDQSGTPTAELDGYKQEIRNLYKNKLPHNPTGAGDNYGRLVIMPEATLPAANANLWYDVKDVMTYNYSNANKYAIGDTHSYQTIFKLPKSGTPAAGSSYLDVPPAVERLRTGYFNYMKSKQCDLAGLSGIWDTSATASITYEEAFQVLQWLFQSDSGIETRMGYVLYDDYYKQNPANALTEDGMKYQGAAMLAMGTVLYAAAAGSPEEKSYYNSRLEEWMTDPELAKKKPLLFDIEPASVWVTQNRDYFVMNCIDYLDKYNGTYESASVRANWSGYCNDWDIYSLLEAAGNYCKNTWPGLHDSDKQLFYYPQGSHQYIEDGLFIYGAPLAMGIYYELSGGNVVAGKATVPGYISNVHFYNDMYGFFLGYNPAATGISGGESGGQDISTEVPELVTIDQDTPAITENPVITLKGNFKQEEIDSWKNKYVATKPDFLISAQITKSSGPGTVISALGALPNDSNSSATMSYDELISFMSGGLTFNFQDTLSGTPIANDQTIKNVYNSKVWITPNTMINGSYPWVLLDPRDGQAIKSYQREPVSPHYISSPETYSEIKNEEPEGEQFEAMAGTPTTRQLYFASGGSEFIVDVSLQYVPNQTTTRNYSVQFSTVQGDMWDNPHSPNKDGDCTGGCHKIYVGGDSYQWSQSITYDYMKITKAQVWKLEKSRVDGMSKITSAGDVINATIKQGDTSAFWNVAKSNNAAGGRILYSYMPEQLDSVSWNLTSSNKESSWQADNQKVVDGFKAAQNTATVVSDFLVLQTTAGDQSVFYFDQKSNTVRTDTDFTFTKTSEDIMWKSNSNTASTWDKKHIAMGSYNGKYSSPDSKYETIGSGHDVNTAFDPQSYGQVMSRPDRPSDDKMLLYKTFMPKVTNKNGLYVTGDAKVFYKHIVNEGNQSAVYTDSANASTLFGGVGIVKDSPYSPTHSKVNDIVLHDPVSSQYAAIIPLDSSRDQRTADSKPSVQVPKQDTTEYINVLPEDYLNNIVFNGYSRYLNSKGLPLGWNTYSTDSGNTTFSVLTGGVITDDSSAWTSDKDKNWDKIQRSFSIQNNSNANSCFYQKINVEGGKQFRLEGDIKSANASSGIWIETYDRNGNWVANNLQYTKTSKGGGLYHIKETGTLPSNCSYIQIVAYQIGAGSYVADNIQLYCESNIGKFTPNDMTALDWKTIRNPLYHSHAESGCTKTRVYDCGNLPLNAGGTLAYKVRNSCHDSYVGYVTNYFEGRMHQDLLNWVSGPSDTCSNHKAWYIYDTTPVMIGSPTTHVHTAACAYHDVWSCGLEDTSVVRTTYDNCTGVLNAGGTLQYKWFNDAHDVYLWYNSNSGHTYDYCSNHTSYPTGNTRLLGGYTYHVHTAECIKTYPAQLKNIQGWASASIQPPSNPQSWEYNQVIKAPDPVGTIKSPNGSFVPGNFINLDYAFQVYFPNVGDFEGTNELGIRRTTKDRGYGFEDNMSTTEWTKSKYVTFDFDVLFNGQLWRAGEKIYLDVNKDTFDFYCPLEDSEAIQAHVDFVAIAINNNSNYLDNDESTNKMRTSSNLRADHSSIKTYYIDVVGRIGNKSIQDTGDFRFANFFKQSYNNGEWLVPNIVPTVDISRQNFIVGDQTDVRGLSVGTDTKYLDTYGYEQYKEQTPYAFPLSPTYNNINALKRQPLRIGYPIFMDVNTIGNYIYGQVDVVPYYYAMDLTNGSIQPVDIYMSVNGSYQLINRFNKLVNGEVNTSGIYDNKVFLNWEEEYERRNYLGSQETWSNNVANYFNQQHTLINVSGSTNTDKNEIKNPYGRYYVLGNNNALALTTRARSFFGSNLTYDINKNLGNRVNNYEFAKQGQRWHFTLTLPSTAVAVQAGKSFISEGVGKTVISDNTHVILTTVDLKAIGETYALKDSVNNTQVRIQTIDSNGVVQSRDYPIGSIPHQVIAVNSSEKTSRDDMTTAGTH